MTEEQRHPMEVWLRSHSSKFEMALSDKAVKFDPFLVAVVNDCIRMPKLMDAARSNPASLLEALLVAANAGLLPGSAHDQFYLVPFGGEVKGIIGYKGLCELAYRHPRVHAVEAYCVYEKETFRFEPGRGELAHVWNPTADRSDSKIVAAYAKVILTDPQGHHVVDRPVFEAMTRAEIDKVMQSSKAWRYAERNKKDSTWHLHYPRMARKTVLRRLVNGGSVPRRNEIVPALAFEAEETVPAETIAEEQAPPVDPQSRTGQIRQKLKVEVPSDDERTEAPEEQHSD